MLLVWVNQAFLLAGCTVNMCLAAFISMSLFATRKNSYIFMQQCAIGPMVQSDKYLTFPDLFSPTERNRVDDRNL